MIAKFPVLTLFLILLLPSLVLADDHQYNFDENNPLKKYAVELTLSYNSRKQTLKVIQERVIQAHSPTSRHFQPQADQFVIQLTDDLDTILSEIEVTDPTLLRAEWPSDADPLEPGLLTGQELKLEEVTFIVIVPLKENLARVKFLRTQVTPEGKLAPFSKLGEDRLDQTILKAQFKMLNKTDKE